MISIGVIGGTGYTGKKLVQYLTLHPFIKDYRIYAKASAGANLHNLFPDLYGYVDNLQIKNIDEISYDHDLYFIALPHGEALNYAPKLISKDKFVIDLGGDYRLDFEELYIQWYKYTHSSAYLLKEKVYGLADHPSTDYAKAKLIANPGCYPTAVLLSILPLLPELTHKILSVSCVAYSGTSGAGKSLKADLLLSEMYGNVKKLRTLMNIGTSRRYFSNFIRMDFIRLFLLHLICFRQQEEFILRQQFIYLRR